jgi:hypothetical protein
MTQGAMIDLGCISASMAYVLWHEEHLWNVGVLQRAHLSNLVKTKYLSPFKDTVVFKFQAV